MGRLLCVLQNRRQKAKLPHVRRVLNRSLNCSSVSAEAGCLRNVAHLSSSILLSSPETSKASSSGPTDAQSSSTSCSFSRADRALTSGKSVSVIVRLYHGGAGRQVRLCVLCVLLRQKSDSTQQKVTVFADGTVATKPYKSRKQKVESRNGPPGPHLKLKAGDRATDS